MTAGTFPQHRYLEAAARAAPAAAERTAGQASPRSSLAGQASPHAEQWGGWGTAPVHMAATFP